MVDYYNRFNINYGKLLQPFNINYGGMLHPFNINYGGLSQQIHHQL